MIESLSKGWKERKNKGRHHYSGYGEGKARRGQGDRRGQRKVLENGKESPSPGERRRPHSFGKYSGTEVKIDGGEHLI